MSDSSPTDPANLDEVLKQYSESQVVVLLRQIQFRLGTPHELATDVRTAQALAHRLANLRTAARLDTGQNR